MHQIKRTEMPDNNGSVMAQTPHKLTYAATVDIRNVEHEITDFMVRRACEEMESQQQFPFAAKNRNYKLKVVS